MEALVITLREGVEAALVVGLILAYLHRAGQAAQKRYVYAGLLLAATASIAGAIAFNLAGVDPENELLEGILLAAAAVLVVSLVVWMWRASRHIKRQVEDRLQDLTAAGGKRGAWGLLGFTFFMVFREGVELILFLAALSLAEPAGVVQGIGAAAGLGLAVLFGALLVRGSLRIDLRRFFSLTSIVLVILAVRLLAGSIHEFSEVGVLPSTPLELRIVSFLVNDFTSLVILIVLILLPVLALLPGLRVRPEEEAARPGESPADRQLRIAGLRRGRFWGKAAVGVFLAMAVLLSIAAFQSAAAGYRPKPQKVSAPERMGRIPVADLPESRLAKFLLQDG